MKWSLDPHPFARSGAVTITCTSIMHLYLAALLIGWATTAGSTSIIAMLDWATPGHHPGLLIIELLLVVGLAMAGVLYRLGWVRIFLFLPQHYLLGVMAYGGFSATFQSTYLDETPMPWPHISADQFGFFTLFAIYSHAIYRRARAPNG